MDRNTMGVPWCMWRARPPGAFEDFIRVSPWQLLYPLQFPFHLTNWTGNWKKDWKKDKNGLNMDEASQIIHESFILFWKRNNFIRRCTISLKSVRDVDPENILLPYECSPRRNGQFTEKNTPASGTTWPYNKITFPARNKAMILDPGNILHVYLTQFCDHL